jgi:septum formation protein
MQALLLASSSPRRRELLENLGLSFDVYAPDLDEDGWDELPVGERVLAIAQAKAMAALPHCLAGGGRWILAADTLVYLPDTRETGHSLGKPLDEADARRMMTLLAGRSHEVHTGLALYDSSTGLMDRIASLSRVHFAPMDEAELASYLASGDWRGVAGAYRVQGRAALHIERIEGSWSGIVGLPLRELYVILARSKFGLYGAKPV